MCYQEKNNRTLRNRQRDLWACNKNSLHVFANPKNLFFTFYSNSPVSSRNSEKKCPKSVSKPDILHPRSPESMKEKYPYQGRYRTDQKTSFFARVMTSSIRMEYNFARLFPYVNVFLVEKICQIGSSVPEILFENCYHSPLATFIKGIFNALICYNIF